MVELSDSPLTLGRSAVLHNNYTISARPMRYCLPARWIRSEWWRRKRLRVGQYRYLSSEYRAYTRIQAIPPKKCCAQSHYEPPPTGQTFFLPAPISTATGRIFPRSNATATRTGLITQRRWATKFRTRYLCPWPCQVSAQGLRRHPTAPFEEGST